MIEVHGLLGAVEAADVAVKSAAVTVMRSRKVGAGLVTVFLTGDVAAVRSAVDAAVAALGRIGCRCSSHVIPRLSPEVFRMIAEMEGRRPGGRRAAGATSCTAPPAAEVELEEAPSGSEEEVPPLSPVDEGREEGEEEGEEDGEADDEEETVSEWNGTTPDLEFMTVMELRRLARTVGLRTMTRKQIRFAGKAELQRELTTFFTQRGGEGE